MVRISNIFNALEETRQEFLRSNDSKDSKKIIEEEVTRIYKTMAENAKNMKKKSIEEQRIIDEKVEKFYKKIDAVIQQVRNFF